MRLYNGCPDKTLQAVIDDQRLAYQQLAAIGARAVYYPGEPRPWMVWRGLEMITEFHWTIRGAADAALGRTK